MAPRLPTGPQFESLQRRDAMRRAIQAVPGEVEFAVHKESTDFEELSKFLDDSIAASTEVRARPKGTPRRMRRSNDEEGKIIVIDTNCYKLEEKWLGSDQIPRVASARHQSIFPECRD